MIWIFGDSFVAPKQDKKYENDAEPWFTKFGETTNFAVDGRGPKESFTDFLEHQFRIKEGDTVIFVLSQIKRSFDYIDLDIKYYNHKTLGYLHLFHLRNNVKFFVMFKGREDLQLVKLNIPEKDFFILPFSLSIVSHPDDFGDKAYVNHLSNKNHEVFGQLFYDWDNDAIGDKYDFETYETERLNFIYDR
jgi:hypothetical protein|tara:strand:- start:1853 stop:2422 length:570 start_codon:yes stop_codon:yes gene_type:complete